MKLVVGLGNPGEIYQYSRHNSGFMAVDFFVRQLGYPEFRQDKISGSLVSSQDKCFFLKPQDFMNRSGDAVGRLQSYYQIPSENVLIIHDDLDLELGSWQFVFAKGPKVHNGVASVVQATGEQTYRLRLGVDSRQLEPFAGSGADYVLKPMSQSEQTTLESSISAASSKFKEWLAE